MPDRQPELIGKRDSHDCCWSESMPGRRIGAVPMTPAQRQARRRARIRRENHTPPAPPLRRTPSRPKRWAAAVAALIDVQGEYRAWLDNPGLRRGRLCRPASTGRGWRKSCKPLPNSTSRSCRRSIRRAATAATDIIIKLLNLAHTTTGLARVKKRDGIVGRPTDRGRPIRGHGATRPREPDQASIHGTHQGLRPVPR